MDFQPMSPEDMQRTMQFLLQQQAQFAADLSRQREQFAADIEKLSANIEKLSAKTDQIADGLIGLTSIVGQVVVQVREMGARLTTHIERVESHLDVVIEMFERHLREDHGHPPS